jgi:hypothetical protein
MHTLPLWAISLITVVSLFLAAEIGRRVGLVERVRHRRRARVGVGTVQAAVFGLLGLLLAFTYGFVSSRAEARRELITVEANAIGTAYLRADLLRGPGFDQLRPLLREYTTNRLIGDGPISREDLAQRVALSEQHHEQMWRIVTRAAAPDGYDAADSLAIASINEVIDTHTLRMRAYAYRIPNPVIVMLITVAAFAIALTTFNLGVSGRRGIGLSALMVVMIAAVMLLILDIDYPRSGLVRISDAPLQELAESFDTE